jgi:hypothetical protein
MNHYVMKNMQVDLVENSASVCISCDSGKGQTLINLKFPMPVSSSLSEGELRSKTREKVEFILSRALESIQQDA